ncbi:hypothetical protein [Polaribacter glomeratus]|uniref:Lipoprotein n=1 Tax=Polaribacter glomeratus TaxID=102 RepID=A0A2S7WIS2_9FLAO|nr:hypothetical protein [Polaribacter glomeratus]PQJ77494.1 hypothetical protein BTO16_16885 [Polaribacter glomeratus]TXD66087.1 hypothetical protein ESX12_07980 [Polaribacter glomeratus]
MKKIKILALALVTTFAFSSCSTEDSMMPQEQSSELLNTYQLKRDASGAYSVDINVNGNVNISKVKNAISNTNELYLTLSDDKFTQKSTVQTDLFFNDENFKIDFISANSNKTPSISVFDDNIKFVKKSDTSFLEEFSVTKNENGTYDLDFKVINNVAVDFVYNTDLEAYEVHLEANVKSQGNKNFSRTLEKENDKLLQIHFVNHLTDMLKAETQSTERKPVILIDN